MKELTFPTDLQPLRGTWDVADDIRIANVQKRDIYRAPTEPSFVAWTILWKESSGDIKLSFAEVIGDLRSWPPAKLFRNNNIEAYLKTLVSTDGGEKWTDTGWREDFVEEKDGCVDHHIRHVFELPDGKLLRSYFKVAGDGLIFKRPVSTYNEHKVGTDFPFDYDHTKPVDHQHEVSTISTSDSGGRSWTEIYKGDRPPYFWMTGIHLLADGTLVAIGGTWRDHRKCHGVPGKDWQYAIIESKDQGRSWSDPVILAEDDDELNPMLFTEECDFVELDDGQLMIIHRTGGAGCCRQQYLKRDAAGTWQPGPSVINRALPHSGYPYLHRASDGTIFYYSHMAMRYSCDDGGTWGTLDLGFSYYGQLTEVSPGKILAVTQKNIGDCPFPWKYDASMLQTTFDYDRIGVAGQEDTEVRNALAILDVGTPGDFHIALELRADGACGIAYQVDDDSHYRFIALTIPDNQTRMPANAPPVPRNAFMQIGKVEDGNMTVLRKEYVGKALAGSWCELQVSRQNDLLKAACTISADEFWNNTYTCFGDEDPGAGSLALFCNKSTGAFRNVRFAATALSIRDNWLGRAGETAKRIALDAGREE